MNIDISTFKVIPQKPVHLDDFPTALESIKTKDELKKMRKDIIKEIDDLQNCLYAENRQSLLIIFQGMDAAGKDSSIRYVMKGVNPQGVSVHSFKKPSELEHDHDYLWRHYIRLPERGKIGIFNRSHYENVLITRVHKEYLLAENLPGIFSVDDIDDQFFNRRFEHIKEFEETISENGTKVIKFMLHLSKEEQKNRFIKRIEEKEKNWKFSYGDLYERKYWDEYKMAFEALLPATSTEQSPWYVIPADYKPMTQYIMASIIHQTLQHMNPQFPKVDDEDQEKLEKAYQELLQEK